MRIEGTVTALITPFQSDGSLDEQGLLTNADVQLEVGIDGLLALGTTGESATLRPQERRRVVELLVDHVGSRAPLLVGTSSNCTREAIERTQEAEQLGAAAALICAPYYNKPTQEGIVAHFEAISRNCNLPIIVYNIPSRTGVNISSQTLFRIAQLPHVVGVKECSGNLAQVSEILAHFAGSQFSVLAGDDSLALPLLAMGTCGLISVVSNLVPKRIKALVDALLAGSLPLGRRLYYELLPLLTAAFLETNPAPIKAAMNICNKPSGPCRLPLCAMQPSNWAKLEEALEAAKVALPRQ